MKRIVIREMLTLAFLNAAFFMGATVPCAAGERTVWQLGKFDQSSHEFNGDVDFTDANYNPTFIVDRSNPARDWPAQQPGSQNQALGGRAHPYSILFTLSGAPKGAYRLKIAVILLESRIPNLQVGLNGRSGTIFFNRRLSYYAGDDTYLAPVSGVDTVEIGLPSSALRSGENKLVLTAMDDPKDGDGDSVLNYDALELTQDPEAKPSAAPQAKVQPTIFYTESGGQLRELTDVTVTLNEKVRRGEVRLAVGKDRFAAPLSDASDFGQQRFQFAVPELATQAAGQVTVRVNGKTYPSEVQLEPQRKWTLDVVPHIHFDVGYTDYPAKTAEVHNRNIDKLLDEMDAYPEMHFSLDGSWVVRNYLASRNPEAQEHLLNLVREHRIMVPAQLAILMVCYPSLEELIRSTSYSYRLHRKEGLPFEYANITDDPSYTWSYPSILNALGIKYFLAGSNNDRAPILRYGRWNEKSPFWWRGPDGSKVLMSYTRQYEQLRAICGRPAQEAGCRQSLPSFLQQFESPSYKPDVVLIFGSQGEDRDIVPDNEPQLARAWNSRYAYPKMVLTTFPDYVHYIEQRYGSELETVVGDGGSYWEDGFATDAYYLAIDRSSQQRAPSAEKLATIATFLWKNVSGPAEQVRQMWDDLVLYSEHTFTAWCGESRPESDETVRGLASKDQFAVEGSERVNAILDQSLSQLAYKVHVPAPALVVFNPLNWKRSGLVETDLDRDRVILDYADQTPVPLEVLAHHEDYDHVRFLARDVPSLGYRCYRVVSTREHAPAPAGASALPVSNTLENAYYRIEVDPQAGAIKSVYDKQLNRELVDTSSPYRFNQYLYVAGGDDSTQIVYMLKSLPLAKLTLSPSAGGRVSAVRKTSYGQILTYQTSGLHAPSLETDVMLFDGEKKIEFVNRLHKEPVTAKEAVYFAFPIAAQAPAFSYEIQNGWVDPAKDMLKGADVEWFTVQHWVKAASRDGSVGLVPVDAPLVTLGDINRGTWPEKFEPKSGTIFSYVMNNYWHTNFREVQSGDFTFRYALTSGQQLTPEELARVGRAAMTPLEIGQLISSDKFDDPAQPLTPNPTSFLEVDAPNVVVENWKVAEDGQGTILRLLEVGGQSATASLNFPLFAIHQAWRTNAVEENQSQLDVTEHSLRVALKPHEIVSLRLVGRKMNP